MRRVRVRGEGGDRHGLGHDRQHVVEPPRQRDEREGYETRDGDHEHRSARCRSIVERDEAARHEQDPGRQPDDPPGVDRGLRRRQWRTAELDRVAEDLDRHEHGVGGSEDGECGRLEQHDGLAALLEPDPGEGGDRAGGNGRDRVDDHVEVTRNDEQLELRRRDDGQAGHRQHDDHADQDLVENPRTPSAGARSHVGIIFGGRGPLRGH